MAVTRGNEYACREFAYLECRKATMSGWKLVLATRLADLRV